MKLRDWLLFIFYCLVVVVVIAIVVVYIKSILSADIPWWLKMTLLRGR